MANIFQSTRCFTLATYLTTAAFSTVAICPPSLMAANGGINLNDINFGIKIEKIYEKVKRAIDKGQTNKIVAYMFDFKSEVEQYTDKEIDINKQIDQAQKKLAQKVKRLMTNTSNKSRKSSVKKIRNTSIELSGLPNVLNLIFLILLLKLTPLLK